jgi:hypothetical protein
MPRRVNPGGSSLRLAAALAGRPCLTADRAASCSANWPASPPAPRRRRHPGTTASSPTRASGQLITLWWRFVSCPVTRETGTLRSRPRAADQPAYPAAARSSGTRQSLPDSAVPIVAWRIPARPGSVSSWSLDRMTASDFPMQIAQICRTRWPISQSATSTPNEGGYARADRSQRCSRRVTAVPTRERIDRRL